MKLEANRLPHELSGLFRRKIAVLAIETTLPNAKTHGKVEDTKYTPAYELQCRAVSIV